MPPQENKYVQGNITSGSNYLLSRSLPRSRKVLIVVSPTQLAYFNSVCASLELQQFKLQVRNENIAQYYMIRSGVVEHVIVWLYSATNGRAVEIIAAGADNILFIALGAKHRRGAKHYVVTRIEGTSDRALTSDVPNGFLRFSTPLESFEMLEKVVIRDIMYPKSLNEFSVAQVYLP